MFTKSLGLKFNIIGILAVLLLCTAFLFLKRVNKKYTKKHLLSELSDCGCFFVSKGSEKMTYDNRSVPISQKLTLTIKEAAEYSNIGINKIDSMLRMPNCPFVLYVGTKKLVKRREFEQFISQKLTI